MFKFKRSFSTKIIFRSGACLDFPKGYFKELAVVRDGLGEFTTLKYVTKGPGIPLLIRLEEVVAVVTI